VGATNPVGTAGAETSTSTNAANVGSPHDEPGLDTDGDVDDPAGSKAQSQGTSREGTRKAVSLVDETARRVIRELEHEVATLADDLDEIARHFAPAVVTPTEHVIPEIPHDPTSRGGPSA
jgi:hypothetical protein